MLASLTALVFICAPVSAPGLTVPTMPQEQPQETEIVDQGYTGQILLVDAAGLGMLLGSGMNEFEGGVWLGLGTLAFAPAIVHLSHDRGGEALGSIILRPGLTIGGMFAGAALADGRGCDDFCELPEILLGGVVGYGVAAVFDATYLARTKHSSREASWMPTVNATSSSVQLGVGGRF